MVRPGENVFVKLVAISQPKVLSATLDAEEERLF